MFGVLDGHGLFGKEASGFLKKRLPGNFELLDSTHYTIETDQRKEFISSQRFRYNFINWIFKKTNEELISSNFDSSFSGSTAVTIFIYDSFLLCANVGDSRAILGCFNDRGKMWRAEQISIDHKPELEKERLRIIKADGKVDSFKGILIKI